MPLRGAACRSARGHPHHAPTTPSAQKKPSRTPGPESREPTPRRATLTPGPQSSPPPPGAMDHPARGGLWGLSLVAQRERERERRRVSDADASYKGPATSTTTLDCAIPQTNHAKNQPSLKKTTRRLSQDPVKTVGSRPRNPDPTGSICNAQHPHGHRNKIHHTHNYDKLSRGRGKHAATETPTRGRGPARTMRRPRRSRRPGRRRPRPRSRASAPRRSACPRSAAVARGPSR